MKMSMKEFEVLLRKHQMVNEASMRKIKKYSKLFDKKIEEILALL